jgi:hypothetical protein
MELIMRWSTRIFILAAIIAVLILGLNYEETKDVGADYASYAELWVPGAFAAVALFLRIKLKS